MVATLSTWPRAAVPAGILIGNTVLVSLLVSATATATGAHISSLVTMSTAFSRVCHPVRAIIYIFCQIVGGTIGGTLLRAALGKRLAHEIRNASCWIDPEGEVGVWQAASIEFTCAFVLLYVTFLFLSESIVPIKLAVFFTPGSLLTELDWILIKLSCLVQNMGQCLWDCWSVYCKLWSLHSSYAGG